jgi:hypothetical protein
MRQEEDLDLALEGLNLTERQELGRSLHLPVHPSSQPRDLRLAADGHRVRPNPVDTLRRKLMGHIKSRWREVSAQLTCPASSGEPDSCYTCPDAQVITCIVENQTANIKNAKEIEMPYVMPPDQVAKWDALLARAETTRSTFETMFPENMDHSQIDLNTVPADEHACAWLLQYRPSAARSILKAAIKLADGDTSKVYVAYMAMKSKLEQALEISKYVSMAHNAGRARRAPAPAAPAAAAVAAPPGAGPSEAASTQQIAPPRARKPRTAAAAPATPAVESPPGAPALDAPPGAAPLPPPQPGPDGESMSKLQAAILNSMQSLSVAVSNLSTATKSIAAVQEGEIERTTRIQTTVNGQSQDIDALRREMRALGAQVDLLGAIITMATSDLLNRPIADIEEDAQAYLASKQPAT